jgi:hypothetical protein
LIVVGWGEETWTRSPPGNVITHLELFILRLALVMNRIGKKISYIFILPSPDLCLSPLPYKKYKLKIHRDIFHKSHAIHTFSWEMYF